MSYNYSHHKHRSKFKKWLDNNRKLIVIPIILFIFLLAFIVDRINKTNATIDDTPEIIVDEDKNYEAIITVVDGEGESTFTEVWGELIKEGYPICSDLVTDFVGKDGYMDWETIEALNDVGVEFVFHSSSHMTYNNAAKEEVIADMERGVKAMEEHGLDHRMITWISSTKEEYCELGYEYFDGGITDSPSVSTRDGNKSNPMMIADVFGSSDTSYFTFEQLQKLIDEAIVNNGWVVLFTRNNHKMMDDHQIDIYRQAFEYAKEHNVAVVTASEGFDLYYGNKLGNN